MGLEERGWFKEIYKEGGRGIAGYERGIGGGVVKVHEGTRDNPGSYSRTTETTLFTTISPTSSPQTLDINIPTVYPLWVPASPLPLSLPPGTKITPPLTLQFLVPKDS